MAKSSIVNVQGEAIESKIDLNDGFENITPLNDYVLVKVTNKDNFAKRKSGILVAKDESDTMPCLQVVKISKKLLDEGYADCKAGDVLEVADVARLTYFFGPDLEKYSWIDKKYIAGVYRKKE